VRRNTEATVTKLPGTWLHVKPAAFIQEPDLKPADAKIKMVKQSASNIPTIKHQPETSKANKRPADLTRRQVCSLCQYVFGQYINLLHLRQIHVSSPNMAFSEKGTCHQSETEYNEDQRDVISAYAEGLIASRGKEGPEDLQIITHKKVSSLVSCRFVADTI
jgi:hypothetical protein